MAVREFTEHLRLNGSHKGAQRLVEGVKTGRDRRENSYNSRKKAPLTRSSGKKEVPISREKKLEKSRKELLVWGFSWEQKFTMVSWGLITVGRKTIGEEGGDEV